MVERFRPVNMHVNMELIGKAAKAIVLARSDDSKRIFLNTLKQFENKAALLRLKTDRPFVEVPSQESQTGPLSLGCFVQGDDTYHDAKMNLGDLQMTQINAGIGKGKTNLIFHLLVEANKYSEAVEKQRKISFIVLDRVKKDFRNLPVPAAVLDVRDLRINFFDPPPNVPADKWIPEICNALMHVWGWLYASRNYFATTVDKLYQQSGGKKIPTFYEVYQEIKRDKESFARKTNRQQEIQEVNLDRIENTLREFDRCLFTRKTFQLHEFITERVNLVIEADITPDSFALLLVWLLLYVFMHNKFTGIRGNISGENGGTFLVADEAYVIWETLRDYGSARKEIGANFVSLAPLYLRDFSVAIIAASQRPLSPDYQAAANLRIIGYSGDYKDSQYYANSLGNPELLQDIMKLDKGEFLVKNGDKPAALVKVPFVPFKIPGRRITDEELAEEMHEYKQSILEYCREIEVKPAKQEFPELSDTTKSFLLDICNFPDSQLKERYERLRLRDSSQQAALLEVLKSGYVNLVKDNLHSRKQGKYLTATAKGIEWLRSESKDVSAISFEGNVTPVHILYSAVLFLRLRNLGLEVQKEKFVAEKKVDVYAQGAKKVAFEIAVSPDVDIARVIKALEHVDEYYFLCQSVIVEQSIRSRLQGEKIVFRIAADYLLELLDPDSPAARSISNSNKNTPNTQDNQDSSQNGHEQPRNRSSD